MGTFRTQELKSWVRNQLREGQLHLKRLTYPKSERRLVMFPFWSLEEDSSTRERTYNLGENLQALGWRVTIVPFQLELEQRRRILRLEKPNILYIQKGRHKLNFPELYDAPRVVFDLDDADFLWPDDFPMPNQKAQTIKCCEGSDLVLCGSKFVADFCRQYNPNTHAVWTGMALQEADYPPPSQRRPIIAWGTSNSVSYADEREFLGEVAIELRKRVDFEFWIYGVLDFQALQPFVSRLEKHNIKVKRFGLMSFEDYHLSLKNAAVGVHPIGKSDLFSQGKSFGKLNSYMLCGVPIVVQRLLDYPDFFRDGENGMLADVVQEWVEKIYQLLVNPALRDRVATQAKLDFERELSTQAYAQKVHALLETLLD